MKIHRNPSSTSMTSRKYSLIEEIELLERSLNDDSGVNQQLRLAILYVRVGSIEKARSLYSRLNESRLLNFVHQAIFNELCRSEFAELGVVSQSYYDEIYSKSEKYSTEPEKSPYISVWSKVVEIIRNANFSDCLDLGCGPGQFATFLLDSVHVKYTGIDYSSVAISMAEKRCPSGEFRCDDVILHRQNWQLLAYDVVLMLETLEHIDRDCFLLEGVKPGVRVIASVPNFYSFSHVRVFESSEAVADRYGHFFSEMTIYRFELSKTSVIWLVDGVKSD